MAVTPNEILEKKFERAFRGYDEDQVDEFLDEVKEELENKIEENKVLCNQIVGLEVENQDLKQMTGEDKSASGSDGDTDEAIEKAKMTADRYISEAKETAENIIISANRKAEEAIDKASEKIKAMYKQAIESQRTEEEQTENASEAKQTLEQAKSQAEKILTDARAEAEETISKAKEYADTIMEEAEKKANAFYQQKMDDVTEKVAAMKAEYQQEALEKVTAEAEARAKAILDSAEEKAAQTKNVMNIQIANAQKRLEDIHEAVRRYKSKLEEFVKNQSGLLDNVQLDDIDPGAGMNPDAVSGLKAQMLKDVEEAGGLGIEDETERYQDAAEHISRLEQAGEMSDEEKENLSVEELISMAAQDNEETEEKTEESDDIAFSEEERRELEDLLDELL